MIPRKLSLQLFFLTIMFLIHHSVLADEDLYYGGFNGSWIGKLELQNPDSNNYPYVLYRFEDKKKYTVGQELKIDINNENVRVFEKKGDQWDEVKTGQFNIYNHKTDAVIFAMTSSLDVYDKTGRGGWVETWNFVLSHKDKETIFIHFVRSVNNYLFPYNKKNEQGEYIGRFLISSFGELKKSN